MPGPLAVGVVKIQLAGCIGIGQVPAGPGHLHHLPSAARPFEASVWMEGRGERDGGGEGGKERDEAG